VIQCVFDLLPLVSGIYRDCDGPYTKAGKIEEQHLGPVGEHQSHSISTSNTKPKQHTRCPVDIVIECTVANGLALKNNSCLIWGILSVNSDQVIKD
jgi:hypothetical protein